MKKRSSLRIQLTIILIVFIALVLGLVYFFQTTLLDDFYKKNKIASMESTARSIEGSLEDEDDLIDALKNESLSNEVCVRIVSDSFDASARNVDRACALWQLNDYQLMRIQEEVKESGGARLFDNYRFEMYPGDLQDIYIYGLMGRTGEKDALILVSSRIVPLDVTLRTISDQYRLIVVIVVAATILLSLAISRFIVRPLKEIENEARQLPKGDYDETKVRASSEELESLNGTLVRANEEIKKADKARKELIGNVSHDLRTPLTMIVGYGEMIRDLPEENNEENINVIIDEAKRLSTLVDDLLDISKTESGQISLERKDVSLNELLGSVYKQYEGYCRNQGVDFSLETGEDRIINVDEHRIRQVLYNFINNALNYNNKPDRQIVLGSEKHGNKDRIFVYDNGMGIADKDIANVWDRYYKVDKEHKRAHLGSGIGLSLSRDLLEAHGLEYGVESKEGQYSRFYFDV
ncbi:MAG: HAMP domain-containing histidine kinase [Erysipelotrichaceae bacterium]|nr:HAMP domain-containing histidine kinase [Erysipelotrichaceae bacterium]